MRSMNPILPGILLVALLTLISINLMHLPSLAHSGVSPLILAIVLGIIGGNALKLPSVYNTGVQFCAKRLLRLAIVLYGFRVSFQEIASVGVHALVIDIAVVALTLVVGYLIGRHVFKLDKHLTLLISAGSAICGAAAVLAVEDVIKSEPYKATVAVATVVVFGTLSMFVYPALQSAGHFGFSPHQFGVFSGAAIHEVAQALVSGNAIDPETGQIAVIVKMIRVILLVPVLFVLSFMRFNVSAGSRKIMVPWFAFGFLAMIGVHSLQLVSTAWVDKLNQFDIILLTMAMGAIGLETKWSKVKNVGMKPLYFSLFLFLWLMGLVYALVAWT